MRLQTGAVRSALLLAFRNTKSVALTNQRAAFAMLMAMMDADTLYSAHLQ